MSKKIIGECIKMDATTALISLKEVPTSLIDINNYIEKSKNDKTLPVGEIRIDFELTLEDGTITTVGGTLPLWLNKEHVKAAIVAKENELKEIAAKELQLKREKAMASLTAEQLQTLLDLGLLK